MMLCHCDTREHIVLGSSGRVCDANGKEKDDNEDKTSMDQLVS